MHGMNDKIKSLARHAKQIGLSSFLLGIANGKLMSFHFENMPIKDAMQLMISGFHHVISLELNRNKDMPKERKQIYINLAHDFNQLVNGANRKFIELNQKEQHGKKD